MTAIPFEQINAAALAAYPHLLREWFPAGRVAGREFVVGDLRGNPGDSLSINTSTGKWADFAAGEKGGDPISLAAAAFHGGDRVEAARVLGTKLGVYMNGHAKPAAATPSQIATKAEPDWQPIVPPPADAPAPDLSGFDMVHTYRAAGGESLFYVRRREARGDRRKQFVPLTYGRLDGKAGWHPRHPGTPRPLYGLDRLAVAPGATVLICEGEKAADAAQRLFPGMVAMCWPAGSNNAGTADWSPLGGRRVVIWPDNDEPGHQVARKVADLLDGIASSVSVLRVDDLPEKADAADVSPEDPDSWLADRLSDVASDPITEAPPEDDPEYWRALEGEARLGAMADSSLAPAQRAEATAPDAHAEGIVPLGHDRGVYYYLSRSTGQVEAIPAERHSRAMLAHLASETYYWQRSRFAGEKGVDWHAAADDLRIKCRAVGIFDPNRLRGRGAWLDDGRSVLHLGDRLIVDGKPSALLLAGSRHIYENTARLPAEMGEPAAAAAAKRLMDLCVACPWERPEFMGRLLAGWLVIAPVCGAMPWRPHLWITSEHGGGKSWVLDNIVKPMVGTVALEVQSKTTEAGIRQTLGCDARPVIFDEAESQNDRDRERVQLVLDLARQASSEDGASIIKGHHSGRALQYRIRSCFVFSSINVGLSQAADESRTVVLTLMPDVDPAARAGAFAKLKALHAEVMAPGFAAGMLARTLALLPAIRENATVFAEAIARSGQPRRTGDTYGVLLAGAWSLRSPRVATPAEADAFVRGTDWVKAAVSKAEVDPEWQSALLTLLQHRERIIGHNRGAEEVPVAELIEAAAGHSAEPSIPPLDAAQALSRMGLKVGAASGGEAGPVLYLATKSTVLQHLFDRTPWATAWLQTLSRAPGAVRGAANLRFAGVQSKALAIPLRHVLPEDGS